ncbi:Cytochrome P450 [Klebsormidium nitens]|uniref:Cytochrome P450 n=1 Tax=Klebsormidium nitens TaxID=105231 RepID=A0A1Y1IIJ0_KLENI|nr:Cytochrome P450 [Klebsormidium nitens]|eukprot:GAQ88536.1 Cytochrome P450 [Klebsormidium nitens]
MKAGSKKLERQKGARQFVSALFLGACLLCTVFWGSWLAALTTLILTAVFHWGLAPAVRFRHIPGPSFRPFIGNLPELAEKEYPELIYQWSLQYGPVFRLFMGPSPIVVLSDAESIKTVGVKLFQDFHTRPPMQSTETAPVGIVFSKGAYWAGARSAVMPLFHSEQLEAYALAIHGALHKMQARLTSAISEEKPIELKRLTQQLAIDIIGRAAFGVDFDAQNESTTSPLVAAGNGVIDAMKFGKAAPLDTIVGLFFPKYIQDWTAEVLKRIPGTLANMGYVNRRILMDVAQQTAHERRTGGSAERDFLTYLARTARVKDTGRKLSDKEIRAISMEVLVAGSETTATTIAMAVYFLTLNKEAQAKVYEEVDRNAKAGIKEPRYSDLSKYPYVEQVVKETLRIFPVAPMVTRTANRTLDVAGVRIPEGTQVWLAINNMHRNELYFADPDRFWPERFDPQGAEQLRRHPYAYLPFGLGPRMCVGFKHARVADESAGRDRDETSRRPSGGRAYAVAQLVALRHKSVPTDSSPSGRRERHQSLDKAGLKHVRAMKKFSSLHFHVSHVSEPSKHYG